MCAVIGAYLEKVSKADFATIRNVFLESKIRGMHATGMTVLFNGKLLTFKEPVAADKFIHLDDLEEMVSDDGSLRLIGHCRYSTSDLEYNQPLCKEDVSIVHNGVITQELYENWEAKYGIKTVTKNDSELLLHTVDQNPLLHWKDASIAAIELHSNGTMKFYRNGKRPIYFTSLPNGGIITSTKDIAERAGLNNSIEIDMNQYVTMAHKTFVKEFVHIDNAKDLQHVR
jgi:glutamine phosphoribosylpyrophosphate amidotransferase